MFIYKRVPHIQDWVQKKKAVNLKVGFVPTMGALHEGHLSLVERSKKESDVTIVSVFVNPKQFNDPEDLKKYPRPVGQDLKLLLESDVDMIFLPEVEDVYPPGDHNTIDFDPGPAAKTMEGKFRPGHFIGMAEVVYRLLRITTPDQLFMGQKDFQQFAIIRKLIQDFKMPIDLVMCPTIREPHGLAMSSRNTRLSPEARQRAGVIYQTLREGKEAFEKGESMEKIEKDAFDKLYREKFEPEYFEVVNGFSLEKINGPRDAKQIVTCCAVKVEGVRLIDNMIWKNE
jgi:pantoate--beta-alanine ligase